MTEEDQRKQQFISPSKHKLNPYLMMHFNRTEQYTAGSAVPPWGAYSIIYPQSVISNFAAGSPAMSYSVCDTYYSSVSLLLPMDGTNGSTTFTDYSSSSQAITAIGNAQISTTQSKFGGSSGYFDGSSGLTLPSNTNLAMGTGDFTLEAWIYPLAWSITDSAITMGSGTNGLQVGRQGSTSNFGIAVQGVVWRLTHSVLPTLNTWTHIAVSRAGTTLRLFYNGTQVASGTSSDNFARVAYIATASSSGQFNGYIDDFRITKGVARYTSNFTAPSEANPTVAC